MDGLLLYNNIPKILNLYFLHLCDDLQPELMYLFNPVTLCSPFALISIRFTEKNHK